MIKVGNTNYRNLEEQVQYLTNYHDVNQGLVQWGIRVVGQITSSSELPQDYSGEYGDAIAVGTEAPFFFYIWTRASIEGEPAYWFPFGEISIAGPLGARGEMGPVGPAGHSTMWYSGSSAPNPSFQVYVEGDMYLLTNGQVYRYQNGNWQSVANIKGALGLRGETGPRGEIGPTGNPGPKGDTGDVGGFINIYGILTSTDQLPNPDTLNNRTIAYLLGTGYPYDLYIQVGDEDGPVNWVNSGPLNVSTLVFVNGEAQNTWDADTKADVTYVDNAIANIPKELPTRDPVLEECIPYFSKDATTGKWLLRSSGLKSNWDRTEVKFPSTNNPDNTYSYMNAYGINVYDQGNQGAVTSGGIDVSDGSGSVRYGRYGIKLANGKILDFPNIVLNDSIVNYQQLDQKVIDLYNNDAVVETKVTNGYKAADSTLQTELTNGYQAADNALQTELTNSYTAADSTLQTNILASIASTYLSKTEYSNNLNMYYEYHNSGSYSLDNVLFAYVTSNDGSKLTITNSKDTGTGANVTSAEWYILMVPSKLFTPGNGTTATWTGLALFMSGLSISARQFNLTSGTAPIIQSTGAGSSEWSLKKYD